MAAYRDDLETRRAHVRRLEAELEALREEESLVRSLPAGPRTSADKLLGGPRELVRTFTVATMPSGEALVELARETFGVDGRLRRDGETLVWRGEPRPSPRRVEIRVEPLDEGAQITVKDRGSYRAYGGLAGMGGVLSLMNRQDAAAAAAAFVIVALILVSMFAVFRQMVVKQTRRRSREGIAFERLALGALEPTASAPARARVEIDDDHDDPTEQEVEAEAGSFRREEAAR